MIRPGRFSPPRLSIVVPVVGNPAQMEETLVSVLENRPAGCEVLVVLNQAYNDPYALAGEIQFVPAPLGCSLVEAVNCGISASRAAIVHVLPCGLEACDGWCDAALSRFEDPQVAAVSPLLVHSRNPRRVVSAGAVYAPSGQIRRLRAANARRDLVAEPGYAVAFYRRSALEQLGRFSARFGSDFSTVDLGLGLRAAGHHWVLEPECRMRVAGPPPATQGSLSRGWSAEQLFWRWLPSAGRGRCLAAHALLMAGDSAGLLVRPWRLPEVLGRLAAMAIGRKPRPKVRAPETAAELGALRPHFPAGAKAAHPVQRAAQ